MVFYILSPIFITETPILLKIYLFLRIPNFLKKKVINKNKLKLLKTFLLNRLQIQKFSLSLHRG
jgi:hypothetical protein